MAKLVFDINELLEKTYCKSSQKNLDFLRGCGFKQQLGDDTILSEWEYVHIINGRLLPYYSDTIALKFRWKIKDGKILELKD